MRIWDAHCHLGVGRYKKQTLSELLERMDRFGVEKSVVVPVEEYIAVDNREGNRLLIDAVEQSRGRLLGFATANPWFGKQAETLLEDALKAGLSGVKFNPAVQGFHLNDPLVEPLIELAEKYGVPVYFHTGTPVSSIPFQLYDLALRYPKVRFIMGHSGYSDFWNDVPFIARHSENIWFDTSLSLSSRTQDILSAVGHDRILFGSDSPHSGLPYELSKVRAVQADEQAMEAMLGGNLRKLLGFS